MMRDSVVLQKSGEVDAKSVLRLRDRLGLSQERLARLLDVTGRTVARWEKDEARPESFLAKKLLRIRLITDKLEKAGGPEEITAWLEKPDPSLRGYSPIDLLASGYATEELMDRVEEWFGTPKG